MGSKLALFQVFETRVKHFFHPTQLRAPGFPHVVEASIHVATEVVEPGVVDQNPGKYRECRHTHGKCGLNRGISH